MANRRREVVGYRPFQVRPLLAEGLLAVARPGGEVEASVAQAMFRMADEFGARADAEAQRAGARAGKAASLAGGPHAEIPVGGAGRVRGARFSGEVNAAIEQAAARHGQDAGILSRIAQIESGGNPRAKNPRSSAGGLFQFVDGTAADYGLANRFDATQASDAGARLLRDNRNHLRRVLGREPTGGELYLAHQQGAGGAAKLLGNPGASASSLVGAKAVMLNGGRPGMTAQEFASLWTRKFDGGYSLAESPDQLPAASPAGSAAGGPLFSGGTWRPRGDDTIYGRAYDEAGTRVYLDMLETEMRSTVGQLFDRHRDDPEGLQRALGDLQTQLGKEHVFDEIQADYQLGFARLGEQYMEKARDNLARKLEEQQRAAFIERTSALSTDLQKKLVDFDPADPRADQAIGDALSAVDRHYDEAVANGTLDADAAARAKVETRRSTATVFYEKQAEDLDADGVRAMREKMKADFTGDGVPGLDGEGYAALDAKLEALETKKRSAASRVDRALRSQGDKIARLIADGGAVPTAEIAQMTLEAGTAGQEAIAETWSKIHAARAIGGLSVAHAAKHVAGLKAQYGDNPTAAQLRTVAFAEDLLEKKRKAIAEDPVSYAEKQGLVAPTPMLTDAADPAELVSIVAERAEAALVAGEKLAIAPRFLKAGEAKALADKIRADPAQGGTIAAALVYGAGPAAPTMLAEFGQDAPMIAEAGSIVAFGGSERAAEDVILGYGKGVDGKTLKGLKPEAAKAGLAEVVGGSLALVPRDGERIGRAASAITRRRIAQEGVEPDSEEAIAIHRQAVQEAAGAVFDKGVQFGGFVEYGDTLFSSGSTVIVPPQMRADRFEEVLASLTDADLAALKNPPRPGTAKWAMPEGTVEYQAGLAATLADAVPVLVEGGYAFALGDPGSPDAAYVQGKNGKLFVLPLDELAPTLAKRVPGAFR